MYPVICLMQRLVTTSLWNAEDIVAGAFVYLDEYTEVIFEQYKPRITPATPIPPITISTRILSDNAAINGSVWVFANISIADNNNLSPTYNTATKTRFIATWTNNVRITILEKEDNRSDDSFLSFSLKAAFLIWNFKFLYFWRISHYHLEFITRLRTTDSYLKYTTF